MLISIRASVAALLLFCLLPFCAHAQDGSAKRFVQSIYSSYIGEDANGVRWRGSHAGRYFDPVLARLIERDIQETNGEVGRLGADPFINAQAFEISALRIDMISETADQARGVVSFINMSQRVKIQLDLVRTPHGWRVSNIVWPGQKQDLLAVMSGPLEPN